MAYYRQDGVRIAHDPYAEGMGEKYGRQGETDSEGFDPYADTVGAGIYGGEVQRDAEGIVVKGEQYQNHNPQPGPVYTGNGYTAMTKALRGGEQAIAELLDKDPALVNEISTGGATPLHMCGMGRDAQRSTSYIISRGGEIEAIDSYGYTPLHRMASNNLAVGAEALLKAGADPNKKNTLYGDTPMKVAMQSRALDVVKVLQKYNAL